MATQTESETEKETPKTTKVSKVYNDSCQRNPLIASNYRGWDTWNPTFPSEWEILSTSPFPLQVETEPFPDDVDPLEQGDFESEVQPKEVHDSTKEKMGDDAWEDGFAELTLEERGAQMIVKQLKGDFGWDQIHNYD